MVKATLDPQVAEREEILACRKKITRDATTVTISAQPDKNGYYLITEKYPDGEICKYHMPNREAEAARELAIAKGNEMVARQNAAIKAANKVAEIARNIDEKKAENAKAAV